MKRTERQKQSPHGMSDEMRQVMLERLGAAIAQKRKDAIDGRVSSGIEDDWTGDEDFYLGIDDANRHEYPGYAQQKPTEGGRSTEQEKPKGCILFPNITAPYVDMAAAKVGDMLLPTDDRNFVVEPSPVPDILDEEDGFAVETQAPGAALAMPQPGNEAAAIMADPAAAAGVPAEADPLALALKKLQEIRQKAFAAAGEAQDQIDDLLTECQYQPEFRAVIDDAARIGTGVIKGPVPMKRKTRVARRDPATGEVTLVVKEETKAGSKRVDPWNLFPAPSCGESIHDGSFVFERDFLTRRRLTELKGGHGKSAYLDSQIDLVLKEGPSKRSAGLGWKQSETVSDKDVFEVWYFYGVITGEELESAGCECPPDQLQTQFPVLVTMVNDTVIKAAMNPLESGEFPYDLLVWKKRKGMPWGVGVARQGRTAQRTYTAAFRNLMDNAGAAAKPHKVMTDAITQGADPWTWEMDSEGGPQDVTKAMTFFVQPSLQQEMQNILQMAQQMMELQTGLPLIMLGMQGNVQETAAGRALQNNNGSTVLRRIARNFDACTEAHIRRYHTWMLVYGEDYPQDMDLQIKARGSSALVERDIQNQQLPALLQMFLNPAFEKDPKLGMDEYLKSQRFNAKSFDLTDERKQELASRMQPPPMPQVEVAKIRDAGETQRLQMRLQSEMQESSLAAQLEERMKLIDVQLAREELAAEEKANLQKHKVAIASLVMELRQQAALTPGPQVRMPPTEPVGRAPNGMAFQR